MIELGPSAPGSVSSGRRSLQGGAEQLKINEGYNAFQAVSLGRNFRQPRINVKKSRGAISRVCVPPPNG